MRKNQRKWSIEPLEIRTFLSASPSPTTTVSPLAIYSADGSGNNLTNTSWGAAGAALFRGILAANYGDGVSTMTGTNAAGQQTLPSARLISNILGTPTDEFLDDRNL